MTEKTKHTPAPWCIKEGSLSHHCCFDWTIAAVGVDESFLDEYPTDICEIIGRDEESKANARLIASAPEMLEILIELIEDHDRLIVSDGLIERARELLSTIKS